MFASLEARPYALLLCFTSVAICCWQAAMRGRHKRLATAGIAVAMSAAIFPIITGSFISVFLFWPEKRFAVGGTEGFILQ
jgi:vacuolar-type H+-ATPase subunit I/STV1